MAVRAPLRDCAAVRRRACMHAADVMMPRHHASDRARVHTAPASYRASFTVHSVARINGLLRRFLDGMLVMLASSV